SKMANALTAVTSRLAPKPQTRRAIEGREFCLSFGSESDFRLSAQRIRLENERTWELQEGSLERSNSSEIHFRRAALTVAGAQAGQLTCVTTNGIVELNLIRLASSQNP